jgi:lipopolysaccharide transport system permease protein
MTPTVIRPPGRWPGLGLGEAWRQRQICFVLAKRSLMVRYRQTVIGAAWSLLQPLLLMSVFTVFFGLFARLPSGNLPYPIFYLLGLVPWHMVSKLVNQGSTSVVSNATLVTRVYIPRAYFPTSIALASLFDLALALVPLALLLVIFGIVPGATVVLAPVFIAVAWLAALGLTYWLSALNVAYRDITQLLPFLTQLWMFSSPIIYPVSMVPEAFRTLYYLNLVVTGLRWSIAGAPAPEPEAWALGLSVTAVLFVSGYLFFRHREPRFADVI